MANATFQKVIDGLSLTRESGPSNAANWMQILFSVLRDKSDAPSPTYTNPYRQAMKELDTYLVGPAGDAVRRALTNRADREDSIVA